MAEKSTQQNYIAAVASFRKISEKLYVEGDKIYKDNNIDFKASWYSVFNCLAAANHPKTVVEIAEEVGFTHITVKNVVRELETDGFVKVKDHPSDGRSLHISLTATGKKLTAKLEKIWIPFGEVLKKAFDAGHPDFLNIINRVEKELMSKPISHEIKKEEDKERVTILDYKPSLKKIFNDLAGKWLLGVLGGTLEEEDKFTLLNPDKAYLETGGFVFFAMKENRAVGCVALKRLNEDSFEFAKLFIHPTARNLGVATKLVERCISRCRENGAKQLWLQTTMAMPEAHMLYYKMGFDDRKGPRHMSVLKRTEKVMVMDL